MHNIRGDFAENYFKTVLATGLDTAPNSKFFSCTFYFLEHVNKHSDDFIYLF